MTATVEIAHVGEDTAGPVTEEQHSIYDQLKQGYETVLLSVTEKATGQQRALIAGVLDSSDGQTVDLVPVALILDRPDDLRLFETPSNAEVVDPRQDTEQSA